MMNEFGIEVGDLFYNSWGYEQTNIGFYQVVKLVGRKSVQVVEVCPERNIVSVQSTMSQTFIIRNDKMLAPLKNYSVFIDNNTEGDLKRVAMRGNAPYITIADHMATLYQGEELYESTYY